MGALKTSVEGGLRQMSVPGFADRLKGGILVVVELGGDIVASVAVVSMKKWYKMRDGKLMSIENRLGGCLYIGILRCTWCDYHTV